MNETHYKIDDLIPHSGLMSLLDRVQHYNDTVLVAAVSIRKDSLFYEPNKGVPALVGIEYMGQAIAAFAGVGARNQAKPVKIGFLVSSRKYQANVDYFPLGAQLTIQVLEQGDSINGLQVFECVVSAEGIHVTANLNVYMPEDAAEFLQGAANG